MNPAYANRLGVAEASRAIRIGALSCADLMKACLDRIDEREGVIGAWEFIDRDGAMAQARRCDAVQPAGLLHGIPLGVKDIIDTADMPTTYGSPIYHGRRPQADAQCVTLLKRAGAIVVGKTVSTEFAYFAPGKTANPVNTQHTPGGSSSGSAAAVADMMVPVAFGTQTAASIIRPASYCGIVGYKPSFAHFRLTGIKPFAASFDTLGFLTRGVEDAAIMRAAMFEKDTPPSLTWQGGAPRVGVCRTPRWPQSDAATFAALERAADALARGGAHVEEFALPDGFARLVDVHKLMMAFEAAASLRFEYDTHGDRLSRQLTGLIEEGLRISPKVYNDACDEAARARNEFGAMLRQWDGLLTPSATGEAPRGLHSTGDPLLSRMWTLLHVPSISLPGMTGPNAMPIGVQLIGAREGDGKLLALAYWAEGRLRLAH
jgi:Asp-tRNA(Asn)/Glu-tRNA(Gln) amidotransferase A subunit family amidase